MRSSILASLLSACLLLLLVLLLSHTSKRRRRSYNQLAAAISYRTFYNRRISMPPPRTISYHEPIDGSSLYFYDLDVTGPLINSRGDEYYDVVFPTNYWFDYSDLIVKHWKSTLPKGISKIYDYMHPKIFFNGRLDDPYRYYSGHHNFWTDTSLGYPQRSSLWTVALTNKAYAMWWIYEASNLIGAAHGSVGYIAVYKLKENQRCITIASREIGGAVPYNLRNADYIIARTEYWSSGSNRFPDAYVFTRAAQATNCPLEIVRVYRIHFKHRGCVLRLGKNQRQCCYDYSAMICTYFGNNQPDIHSAGCSCDNY